MNTINNYSNINFFCKAFVQAAPPVNKTIAIIAAIALAVSPLPLPFGIGDVAI